MTMIADLKTAGIEQVRRALASGGELQEAPIPVYSGGYRYTHVLYTKRGNCYRVSGYAVKALKSMPTTQVNAS